MGLRYLDQTNDTALVFSVSAPLAFENPNRGRIAAARAQRELSTLEAALNARRLRLQLLYLRRGLANSNARARQLEQSLLPLADQLLGETRRGYSQGRLSVLQWTDAQAERYALEKELLATRLQAHLQLLELERITSTSLSSETGENP